MLQFLYMRLDIFLAEHGFTTSRNKAQELISRGLVFVNGRQQGRASFDILEQDYIEIKGSLPFVSRAGEKLAFALDHFSVDPTGLHVLDIGSSTGGFTDVVLQKGAASVTAVDVGTGQFDRELSQHPRVELFEKTDIRNFYPHKKFNLIVIDVSFISQKEIISHLERFSKEGTEVVALIKPQFEVGSHNIGKGGIVNNPDAVLDILQTIQHLYEQHGYMCVDEAVPAQPKGSDGNQEYFLHVSR